MVPNGNEVATAAEVDAAATLPPPPAIKRRGGVRGSAAGLGYCAHTATISLYPQGFILSPVNPSRRWAVASNGELFGGKGRGKIRTFSAQAAYRCRQFLLTYHVPDFEIWDVSNTIPGTVTDEEFERAHDNYAQMIRRAGGGAVIRIELQRRKEAHTHCAIWLPKNLDRTKRDYLLHAGWIHCLPEANQLHPHAWARATKVKGPYNFVQQSHKWFEYLAAHTSKKKQAQLGYEGKQWTVINRKIFAPHDPLHMDLSSEQEKRFKRTLTRWIHSHSMRTFRKDYDKRKEKGLPIRKPKRMFLFHNQRWLRLIHRGVVVQVAEWVKLNEE